MNTTPKTIAITGGAGFIGSHLVRLLVTKYPHYNIINVDALTYAGNLQNLTDIDQQPNYSFYKLDITDEEAVATFFAKHKIDGIIHLAAESHVDRSITNPLSFVKTNILGTANLLNACKQQWQGNYEGKIFYHVSTDEVFGSLGPTGFFTETTAYDPRSPYSASKAGSDHLVMAYYHTYHFPVKMSNCSNNYGSHHFPEKLIPLLINNIKNKKPLPIYGKGDNVRDWLYVTDHALAIDTIYHYGVLGESYNVGGHNEWKNIDVVHLLCTIMDKKLGNAANTSAQLITYVTDRAGHDMRYAIDATKLATKLGWKPTVTFEEGLEKTVDWYLQNTEWIRNVTSGDYQTYYTQQYA